jgi:hypothetical protein
LLCSQFANKVVVKMQVRPQDVLVASKLLSIGPDWTYARLAGSLALSQSEAHAAVNRCVAAGVLAAGGSTAPRVLRRPLLELLLAAPKIFVAERGPAGRGVSTSVWSPALRGLFDEPSNDRRLVWPTSCAPLVGEVGLEDGLLVSPLYSTAARACRQDQDLYAILSLVDVLRLEKEAERRRAATLLRERVLGQGGTR